MIFTLNFHQFLHTMCKYVLISVVKISLMFAPYFEYYAIILGGAFFRGHCITMLNTKSVSASHFNGQHHKSSSTHGNT